MTPPALAPDDFRRLGHEIVELVAAYLAGLRARPVFRPMDARERRALLEQPLGEAGAAPEVILEAFRGAVLPHPMGNGHPRFFGWVNSPPAPIGVLAEFLAAAMNPSCAGGDHAAIYLERGVIRWLMELVGFPTAESMGLLVSGGSMASLIGLAAARHRVAAAQGWNVRDDGLQAGHPPLMLYVAEEGHSCLRKAAELLGLGAASSLVPPYLRTREGKGFGGLPWFSEYGPEQTRGFRALKLWMVLQHLGRRGVASLVARHIALATHLAACVDAAPDLERLAPVELSIVCFRYVPPELRGDHARLNDLNQRIMEAIQSGGNVFLTGTVLRGDFALRACVLHYATTEDDVAALVDVVRTTGAALAGERAR